MPCAAGKRVHMWRILKQYSHFVFSVIQSGITCAVAAAIASLPFHSQGTFAVHWVHAYLLSWVVMLPVVLVAAPVIRRLANAVTR